MGGFVKYFYGMDNRSFIIVREDIDGEFLIEAETKSPDLERYSKQRIRFSKKSLRELIPILQEAVKPKKFKKG